MNDAFSILGRLKRPRLLVRAAHLGLEDYNRERSLRQLLPDGTGSTGSETFRMLIAHEADLDSNRVSGDATYSAARHIETLAALLFEARLLRISAL